ncbi:MAG: hypothetical protein ACR2H9_06700, partial [Longimicrobiaceae bacterium]
APPPLPPGRYTYLLSVDRATGALALNFIVGDQMPSGRQRSRRSRVVNLERRHELEASVAAADGGALVAGTRVTVLEINPTVSTQLGSRVIYLPDARVLGITYQGVLLKLTAAGQREWLRELGEDDRWTKSIRALVPAPGGGCLLAGEHHWSAGEDGKGWAGDAWLVRVSAAGEPLWSRGIGRPDAEEQTTSLRATLDGGYIVAGASGGLPWLAKTDPEGRELWSRTYGSGWAMNYVEAVHPLPDGGYVLAGDRHGVVKETGGGTLIRTDAAGEPRWTTGFAGSAEALLATSDGGFLVAGAPLDRVARVARFDGEGNLLWSRRYLGGSSARALAATPDGGFVVGGGPDFWLLRADADGVEEWRQSWPGRPGSWPVEIRSIQPTGDGGFLLVGSIGHDARILKIDARGRRQWEHVVTGQ